MVNEATTGTATGGRQESILGKGVLSVCPENPRYFTDSTGKAIYLAGSQTWATLQERRLEETPVFDYDAWLAFLRNYNHN